MLEVQRCIIEISTGFYLAVKWRFVGVREPQHPNVVALALSAPSESYHSFLEEHMGVETDHVKIQTGLYDRDACDDWWHGACGVSSVDSLYERKELFVAAIRVELCRTGTSPATNWATLHSIWTSTDPYHIS